MRRFWGILASAVITVGLEVAIKLVADSIAVPRKYYFVPVVVFVVLVGLQFVLTLRDQRAPERGRARPDAWLTGGRHTLRGRWHPPSQVMVVVIVVLASLCLILGLLPLVRKTPAGLLIATLFLVTVLAGLCVRVALGFRVHLQFSATGVAVWRNLGRKRRLRWDEGTNFRVSRAEFVAKPVPGSTWYLQGWDRIDRDGVIYICNLDGAGIAPAAVEAAVEYWRRTRQSRGYGSTGYGSY
jgi:hypothetical protein